MPLNISFTTTFNRVTNTITFVDTTNYVAQGFILGGPASMKGYIKVSYNTGAGDVIVYNNLPTPPNPPWPATASSNVGANVVFTPTINIPLTSSGDPIPATYTVTYYVAVFAGLLTFTDTQINTYQYHFTDPDVCIETVINCLESAIQSTDDTDYSVPNGTITSIVRQHTLYPPPASGQPTLGPLNNITLLYTPIYTTTWTAEVISTVTYLMNDGLIVIVELSGVKEFQALCDTNLSKIICCLVNLQKEYEALECKNPVKAAIFKSTKLDPSLQHLALFLAAQSAGNQSKMDTEYAALLEASGCGGDCGCGDSTPVLVQPTGLGFTYNLTSTGGTIDITTTVVGSAITWNVEVDPAILAAIQNVTTTVVSTNTPSYLTVTQVGAAPNLNYQVDFIDGALGDYVEKLFTIDPTVNVTPDYLEYNVQSIVNRGLGVNPVGGQITVLGLDINSSPVVPNTAPSFAAFLVSNILITPTNPYTVDVSVMSVNSQTSPPNVTSINNIAAEVYYCDVTSGDVYFRLINPQNGSVYTLQDIKTGGFGTLLIKFNLTSI